MTGSINFSWLFLQLEVVAGVAIVGLVLEHFRVAPGSLSPTSASSPNSAHNWRVRRWAGVVIFVSFWMLAYVVFGIVWRDSPGISTICLIIGFSVTRKALSVMYDNALWPFRVNSDER